MKEFTPSWVGICYKCICRTKLFKTCFLLYVYTQYYMYAKNNKNHSDFYKPISPYMSNHQTNKTYTYCLYILMKIPKYAFTELSFLNEPFEREKVMFYLRSFCSSSPMK